jgi:hypothetical protein
MKDWHWIFVFAVILITPLLPNILREKCPGCNRRKMQSLETLKVHSDDGPHTFAYITFYRCDKCSAIFKRNKSGPLEESSQEEYRLLSEAAVAARHPES